MSCDHTGPQDVIAMAEQRLREQGEEARPGMRFRFAENHDGFFAAAITEVERRGEEWVVVRLDRLKEALPESEVGFRQMVDEA